MLKKNDLSKKILVIVVPIFAIIILYFSALFVAENITLPPCYFNAITGWYCPGCGNTRSVIALLNGDVLLSLRQNVMIILFIVIGFLLYLEFALNTFGIKFCSPIKNNYFLFITLGVMLVYFLIRNFIPQIAPI